MYRLFVAACVLLTGFADNVHLAILVKGWHFSIVLWQTCQWFEQLDAQHHEGDAYFPESGLLIQ